jgi:hypothetical protein
MSSPIDINRGAKFLDEAKRIHLKYPLFDGHNDLPWAIRNGFDMKLSNIDLAVDNTKLEVEGIPWRKIHTDLPRLRKGGVGAQFWSVFVPCSLTGAEAIQVTLEQIDVVHQLCDKYPADFAMAETAADVMRLFKEGKIASVCGIEGGVSNPQPMPVIALPRHLTLPSLLSPLSPLSPLYATLAGSHVAAPNRGKFEGPQDVLQAWLSLYDFNS